MDCMDCRKCRKCGKEHNGIYGELCEDCWANVQQDLLLPGAIRSDVPYEILSPHIGDGSNGFRHGYDPIHESNL